MTQDYKDTLLRYLTGNLIQETGVNKPQLSDPVGTETTIGYDLDGYDIIDIIQGYQSSYSVIYGNHNNKGFIAILNENNELEQIITEYTSGTDFGEFQILNVDEEGKFYGIDIDSGTPRFIMLNNIVLRAANQTEFSVKLRQSYNLPSPLSTATNYFGITKAVGQGKYLIGAIYKQNNLDSPLVTELTINVGSTNTWTNYTNAYQARNFTGQSIWASWDNDTLDFKICGYNFTTDYPNYVEYIERSGGFGELYETTKTLPTPMGFEDGNYQIQTIIQNKNLSYIGIFGNADYGLQDISIYYYKGVDITYLTGTSQGNIGMVDGGRRMYLKTIGNTTYYMYKTYWNGSNPYLHITVGRLTYDSSTGFFDVSDKVINARDDTFQYEFYVTNNYNLYNYNVICLDYSSGSIGGTNYIVQEVYNTNNYNGLPYENTNSLVPNSGILYDSNDMIIFARNLYNKSVYDNKTLSIIQIPNLMLNNVTIATQNLLGQTNKTLVSNTDSFTKNIYETVYLNFYNTILIEDRNTPNYIINHVASGVLNQSVSTLPNETRKKKNTRSVSSYDNVKATKYRLNYSDNTTSVDSIQATITSGIATYSLQVAVPYNKSIDSLEIISQDENTVYQKINLSSLQNGKIYTIEQECHIE